MLLNLNFKWIEKSIRLPIINVEIKMHNTCTQKKGEKNLHTNYYKNSYNLKLKYVFACLSYVCVLETEVIYTNFKSNNHRDNKQHDFMVI